MSKLVRKIDYLKDKDIYLILTQLSQYFLDNRIEINSKIQEETTALDSKKVAAIKKLLKILVENDEVFAQKVATLIKENRDNIPQDISIVSTHGTFIISWAEIGIFISYLLARDLIRAFKPSEEIKEEENNEKERTYKTKKVIKRKYNADFIALAKSYFESKKD